MNNIDYVWNSVIPLAEDYENAIEVLDRDGWTQGKMRDERGRCMAGAVTEAVRMRLGVEYFAGGSVKWMYLARDGEFRQATTIAEWNDEPFRTKQEVQDRLMLAAKNRRNDGR